MKTVLLVECSPRLRHSVSRAASACLIECLRRREPGLRVIGRDLARDPPRLVDEAFTEAMYVPEPERLPSQRAALAQSETLIGELEASDALVLGTPMHNFTVPALLKAWIDQVLRVDRSFRRTPEGKVGLLADRPAYVVVASGGALADDRARQPDFLTPYMEAVLATLGIRSPSFLYVDGARDASGDAVQAVERVEAWFDAGVPLER
jgi:FMN-dependent NADH-azoreductase